MSRHELTSAGNFSHFDEDGVAEFSKLLERLHPAANVHFVFFSYGQAVDGLMGVSLDFQLMYRNIKASKSEKKQNIRNSTEAKQLIIVTLIRFRAQPSHVGLQGGF